MEVLAKVEENKVTWILNKLEEREAAEEVNAAQIDNLERCKYCNYVMQ